MNVLSLFDGISCGQIALERAGILYSSYYASEIDKHAIKVTQNNYPNTIQLGDVSQIDVKTLPTIDLLIGGSPCQGFSFAGKQLNFDDERSKLFFEYVRILNEIRKTNADVKFLLENVMMKKEYQDVISEYLGVQPIEINSSLVSAQNRKRLYWTNIPNVNQPLDKGIVVRDILESTDYCLPAAIRGRKINGEDHYTQLVEVSENNKSNCLTTSSKDNVLLQPLSLEAIAYMNGLRNGKERWEHHKYPLNGKASCLTASHCKGVPYTAIKELVRHLTPIEAERLQTVPDNYTSCISKTQRIKALGNGWTVDVIAHIFKNILPKPFTLG